MSIPPEHSGRYVYHFSHIDNLPNLLRSGFLANNHKGFPRFGHHSIAASGIQKRRAEMAVPCGPGGGVFMIMFLSILARSAQCCLA
ncbi:TPA: DarT ssDNA thymidine ADP-ribosyltransferase family protein [Pseudomonas aeruginosa]